MEKHVFAIDWSLSTDSVVGYSDFVKNLINGHIGDVLDVILWAKGAIHLAYERPMQHIKAYGLNRGNTKPFEFIRLLNYPVTYHLHIVTDGEIADADVNQCDKYMKKHDIFKNILSVKLYFKGPEEWINTKFKNLFPNHLMSININDNVVCDFDPGMPLKDITYDFIMKDDSINAWVLMKLQQRNFSDVEKVQLRSALTLKMHEIIRHHQMKESALERFFKTGQIDECVAYVRTHSYNDPKAQIQRKMSHIWKLFEGSICPDALEALKPTQRSSSPLTFDDEQLEEMPLTCDISFDNIKAVCFPVQQKESLTCTPDEAKVLGRNPLDAFRFIEQNLHLVEPHLLNYSTTHRIVQGDISPFTRTPLRGYYLLPQDNSSVDFQSLMKHNDYVLSTLFVDKLPGVRILWHVVFLYTLALKKEFFSQHRELLFDAIRYLSQNSWYYVVFNPHEEPTFYEKLNVCFWYTAEICQRAFPDSPKNKYKSWENIEPFLQFYKDVFDPGFEVPLIAVIWWCWKYMYSPFTKKSCAGNKAVPTQSLDRPQKGEEWSQDGTSETKTPKKRTKPKVKGKKTEKAKVCRTTPLTFDISHLLSHFYGHKDYQEPKETVLFSDLPVTPPAVKPLAWAQRLGLETVMIVCKAYLQTLGGLSYKEFDMDVGQNHKYSLKVYGGFSEQEMDKMKHVTINPITCKPYVYCRKSYRHWKECAGEYDVPTESSFRLFQRYCEKKKKYPKTAADLMIYKKERLMYMYEQYPIFHTTHEKSFQIVIDCHQNITSVIPVEEYLARCKKYRSEASRLEVDKL